MMATPAPAQTMAEAAWANMAAAVQLCEMRTSDMNAKAQAFRNTGFSEQVVRSGGNSDTTHIFTAPAETVVVQLYYGEMPEECGIQSAHLGVTLASQLLDELIPTLYPTYVRRAITGPAGPSGQPAVCVRYEDPANEIGHMIGTSTDQGCVDDGTSLIYSSYRV